MNVEYKKSFLRKRFRIFDVGKMANLGYSIIFYEVNYFISLTVRDFYFICAKLEAHF